MTKILILCINYNSEDDTLYYINSLGMLKRAEAVCFLVVDNSPMISRRLQELAQSISCFQLAKPMLNLGYFTGAQWGLLQYLHNHPMPEWVIVSNADIIIKDPDFLDKLLTMRRDSDAAIIAPSIISAATQRDQNPFLRTRPSRNMMKLKKFVFGHPCAYLAWRIFHAAKLKVAGSIWASSTGRSIKDGPAPSAIYAPHGSFIIINREFFDRGGDLNNPLPLYGEEVYLAENARRRNLKIVYDPRLTVFHNCHVSTGSMSFLETARIVRDCTDRIFETYYGT